MGIVFLVLNDIDYNQYRVLFEVLPPVAYVVVFEKRLYFTKLVEKP